MGSDVCLAPQPLHSHGKDRRAVFSLGFACVSTTSEMDFNCCSAIIWSVEGAIAGYGL